MTSPKASSEKRIAIQQGERCRSNAQLASEPYLGDSPERPMQKTVWLRACAGHLLGRT